MKFLAFNILVAVALVYLILGPDQSQSLLARVMPEPQSVQHEDHIVKPAAPEVMARIEPVTVIEPVTQAPQIEKPAPVLAEPPQPRAVQETTQDISQRETQETPDSAPFNEPETVVMPPVASSEPQPPAPSAQPTPPVLVESLPQMQSFAAVDQTQNSEIEAEIQVDDTDSPQASITIDPNTPLMDMRTRRKELAQMVQSLENFME